MQRKRHGPRGCHCGGRSNSRSGKRSEKEGGNGEQKEHLKPHKKKQKNKIDPRKRSTRSVDNAAQVKRVLSLFTCVPHID